MQRQLTQSLVDEAIAAALGEAADAALIAELRPLLLDALFGGADDIAEALGVDSLVAGLAHPAVEEYLANHIPKLVRVNDRTRRRVRDLMADSVAKGEPRTTTARRLRTSFREMRQGRRAVTVARTEGGIAWHKGRRAQMVEHSVAGRIWITSRDLRVRRSHAPMDNQCRDLEAPFDTGAGNTLMHPHDPAAPAKEVVNCRCTEAPFVAGCGGRSSYLATDELRAAYWRLAIAKLLPHELLLRRRTRRQWRRQEDDLVEFILAA